MKCIQCLTENQSSLSHCEKCGAPLPVIKKNIPLSDITVAMVIVILLAGLTVSAYFFWDDLSPTGQVIEREDDQKEKHGEGEGSYGDVTNEQSALQDEEKDITDNSSEILFQDLKSGTGVIAGWVLIVDPWGRQVRQFRAGMTGDGWLALPARACLGGNKWYFYPDAGQRAAISGGLWISGDNVGFWHLAKNAGNIDGPQLGGWNNGQPVSWVSLESDNEYHAIKLGKHRNEGFFLSATLPDNVNEIGIFLQNGKIVGWSFGQWLKNGYMWPGKAETELNYNTWVRYFYNMTFAHGREEKFAMTLAMQKGYTGLEQLASFIEGFRLQPRLTEEDTPHYLLPEEIIKKIRLIVTNAIHAGEGSKVVGMLSSQELKNIGDISLLISVVPTIAAEHGFESAIDEIDDSGRYITGQLGIDVPALDRLHLQLYQQWLQSLVSAREVNEGLQVYNTAKANYPDDPHLHLLGVELILMSGNWEEAERLLHMRNYPSAFQDRYQLLQLRISELKGQENKIVIPFPHGSNRITVTATINETAAQEFLVDTGATIVTIPSSTADALGLETVHGSRILSTVSGVERVSEVLIDEIEIDGWVEYNIRALVVDMPGRPGLGLLGLNYLGRFQMDLKPEEGTLLLTPR
jgi:clan AA aspartic protease (TIGR02281 family)